VLVSVKGENEYWASQLGFEEFELERTLLKVTETYDKIFTLFRNAIQGIKGKIVLQFACNHLSLKFTNSLENSCML